MRPERRKDFGKPLTLVERILMVLVYWLGTFTYRLLCSTYRLEHHGKQWLHVARRHPRLIGIMWHQRLFVAPWAFLTVPGLALLVSRSKDGEMIRYVLEGLGYPAIQGSSSRRGGAAFIEMRDHIASGRGVGITPDGPKGPARRAQAGAARLALETGAPLFPAAVSSARAWLLPSWDRFLFPKPFSKVVVAWGTPVQPEGDPGDPAAVERLCRRIEEALERVTEEADRVTGLAAPRSAEDAAGQRARRPLSRPEDVC